MAGFDVEAKAKRYDRQIRIWGPHGQDTLEQAHICVINAGPTGTETLKNLVLGGIKAFTIVDGADVVASDFGNNFMIEPGTTGKRATAVGPPLRELNGSVEGGCVEEDTMALLDAQPNFFDDFSVVIATQMRESELLRLEAATLKAGVPLLIARCYGLVAYLRISGPEHLVIESKPDSEVQDLRFHAPWPELLSLAQSVDLATADDITHKHVPYGLLLIKAAEHWRSTHDGKLPDTSKQKAAFKDLLRSWQHSIDGVPIEEENFAEAISNAHKMWSPPSIPPEVLSILHDTCATEPTAKSADFWLLACALRQFVDEEGRGSLPLQGSIPDMTATTEAYLELQKVYRVRAEDDAAAVEGHLHRLLVSIGRQTGSISPATVRLFCRNARNIRVVRFTKLSGSEPTEGAAVGGRNIQNALAAEDTVSAASMYLLMRAADSFYESQGRWPGVSAVGQSDSEESGSHESDLSRLKSLAVGLAVQSGASPSSVSIPDDLAGEVCRFGAAELHCSGAIVGGMAAQEAIKLLTRQFVPVAGTFVFNSLGLPSSSSVFDF